MELNRVRRKREAPVDEIAPDEQSAHAALINWAEWCRGRGRRGSTLSAEGRYVPPAARVYDSEQARVQVDPKSAEQVNAALLALPTMHRDALKLRYFARLSDWTICRVLATRPSNFHWVMRDSRLMLQNVLRFRSSGFKLPATTRTTVLPTR